MKIISGCQIGIDQIALELAKQYGFETGGYVTNGNRTTDGKRPDLITLYNLIELDAFDYKTRTYANVEHSDCTLLITIDSDSPGTKCIRNAIWQYDKNYIHINANFLNQLKRLVQFTFGRISNENVKVLNVAGNRKGADEFGRKFLNELFPMLK